MARPSKRAPAFQAPSGEAEVAVVERAIAGEAVRTRRSRREASTAEVPSYRIGCVHLGAWVNDAAARQFKAMAMERGVSIREAFVEMLNQEFARKGRPTIAD